MALDGRSARGADAERGGEREGGGGGDGRWSTLVVSYR